VKVPQVPCLYRHSLSRKYYGIKKVGGKRKEHSLDAIDRKLTPRPYEISILVALPNQSFSTRDRDVGGPNPPHRVINIPSAVQASSNIARIALSKVAAV